MKCRVVHGIENNMAFDCDKITSLLHAKQTPLILAMHALLVVALAVATANDISTITMYT